MLTLNLIAIAAAHAAKVHHLLRLLVCLIAYSINVRRKRKIGVNSAPPQGKKRAAGQEENFFTRIIGDHFGN